MGTEERNIKQLRAEYDALMNGREASNDLLLTELEQIRKLVQSNLDARYMKKGELSTQEIIFETLFTASLYAFSAGYMTAYKANANADQGER